LRTVRAADSAILQDLQDSRDHLGNVIEIDDEAQQTRWFDNAQVSPERLYTYDPLYRLSSATGREKVGLAQAGVLPFPVELLPHGGAANTVLRRTTQGDVDDAAGNLTETVHVAGGSVVWRRRAQVAAGNNQVLASSAGLTGDDIDDPTTWISLYSHDRGGNMLVLPGEGAPNGMVTMRDHRDHLDHLESVALKSTDSAQTTYEGAGQRIAKVVNKGQLRHTRLTNWGIEHTTKHNIAGSSPVLEEERGALHIMDDQQCIAMVETRTVTTTGTTTTVHGHAPAPLVRFQPGDLLASACVELDGIFGVLTYPELHPYGATAWWAEDGALEVSKRYRFTGMERDEETGLKVHSQRYHCPWLGRVDRPDPIGSRDGGNRWAYVKGRVTTGRDESGLGSLASPASLRPTSEPPPPLQMEIGWVKVLPTAVRDDRTAEAQMGPSAGGNTHLLGAPDEYHDPGPRVFVGRPPGHMGKNEAPIRSRSFRHFAAVFGAELNSAGYTGVLGPDRSGPWRPHWRGDTEDPQDYLRPVAPVQEDRLK
ncbi:MAG: RHS repeat-associated core domain-containing protein, partial [Deltaproteobacteria bacterium]|nr:RHS repeat-associated core domain-containing protein [Deltaproteobacteria bacterium]